MSRAQIFIVTIFFAHSISTFAQLKADAKNQVTFTDVDGNALSIGDGHTTTVVLTTQSGIDKARAVGDRTPDFCLGNPIYRMVTVLVFEKNHSKPMRAILNSLMRRRLETEGRRLQARYNKLKITRDARRDIFAVADFDGSVTRQFGAPPVAELFQVFVFGRNGELIKQWNNVPSAEELGSALKAD
ncbi:MAG: hypothetical protein JO201_03290 [Verrucomicrobia bacterium]|nr:hypothetical protein [Verrucomicrobiota bacterium]